MKTKFTRILGVGLTVALITSLMVAAIPALALTQPSVSFTTGNDVISYADADYFVYFQLGKELSAGDTITVTFPSDTTVGTPTANITAGPGWIGGEWKNPTLSSPTANWTFSATSRTVTKTLDTGSQIGEGAQVRLSITAGLTNPSAAGSYTLTVKTSDETTAVESASYTIKTPTLRLSRA